MVRFSLFQLGVAYAIAISSLSYVTATDHASVVLRGAAANNTNTVIHHHRALQEDVDVVGLFLIKVIDYGHEAEGDGNPIPFESNNIDIEADGSNRHRRNLPGKSGSRGRPKHTYHVEYSDGTIHEIKNTGTGPPEWVADLVSSRDVIEMKGANINQDGSINGKGKPPTKVKGQGKKNGSPFGRNRLLRRTPEQERNLSELHRQLQFDGFRTVLAVKVVANDAAYSSTAAELQNYVYRPSTSGSSSANNGAFPSKYAECSYNKLTFDPMVDTAMVSNPNDGTTTSIANGVVTIKVNIDVASGNTNFENEVTNQLNAVFGVSYPSSPVGFSHPTELADHIMYCLPPGVMGGAYAYLGHWLSVYNDASCNVLSTQAHEIGHNLRFYHSGEIGDNNEEYGDQVGFMGVSYGGSQPNMCFNSAKSWQAGWYSDKTAVVNTGDCFEDNVYGIASYGDTNANNVIIKVESGTTDYYVTFNYRAGINSGTKEAANQVTVTKTTGLPSNPSESFLEAKLSSGGSYTIASSNMQVSVRSINGDHAVVRISQNGDPCGATSAPTPCPVSGCCGDDICDASLSESFFSCNADCRGLSTNYNGGYSSWEGSPLVGNVFKVSAIGKVIAVKGFIINTATSGSGTVRIYEKSGDYVSDRYNSAAWNLIMPTTSVNGQGPGQPTQVPNLDTPLIVSAGTNKSFLVWCSLGTDSSFEGTALGGTFKQNEDMSIDAGYAVQGEFTGIYVSPLVFNGVVEYDLVDSGTPNPTQSPLVSPSRSPSISPETSQPTKGPSKSPVTDMPSRSPTRSPVTSEPTSAPSKSPVTDMPSRSPTRSPVTSEPTQAPSKSPVTDMPSRSPSKSPSASPSNGPTESPSTKPTSSPSLSPSQAPSKAPTTDSPSSSPVMTPTTESPITANPTPSPSQSPSTRPSISPSVKPSVSPSKSPSKEPTKSPSDTPSASPSKALTDQPTELDIVTPDPSSAPTLNPTPVPTPSPSVSPSKSPSMSPSERPVTSEPSKSPTLKPTPEPTNGPTDAPTPSPSQSPSKNPTDEPTPEPTPSPTSPPAPQPTNGPTNNPVTPAPTVSIGCGDWYFRQNNGNTRDCSWISSRPDKRCNKNGGFGECIVGIKCYNSPIYIETPSCPRMRAYIACPNECA